MIVQDNKVLPAYWGTGINIDAANNVIMRLLIKSRSGGADIDGKRIMTMARELGDQYKEFPVTLGLANSVSAISTAADLNNVTSPATIEGWSSISNTEGYQELDIDNDSVDEEYYSQLDKGTQSLNNTYERTKWISQRAHVADSGTDTATDYTVDNATITGQGQEFTARAQDEKLVEMCFRLKIDTGIPTGPLTAELYDSDEASPAAPDGSALATSEPVLASLITSSYQTIIFRFTDNVTLTADQKYFAVIRHADGSAGAYFSVDGAVAGSDDGNRAEDSTGWTGNAGSDLWFLVRSCPVWYNISGEKFRGITHEVVYGSEANGPFTENEVLFWGTDITYDGGGGPFTVGEYVKFYDFGTTNVINGGKVLADTGTIVRVALEDISQNLSDNDVITGLSSGEVASINATITNDDKAGGEGILLALDDNGDAGSFYIQLISGQAPVDTLPIEGRSSSATAAMDTTITQRTVSPEFIGATTGTNLIGAYGIGFESTDIGSSDKFFDLTNTQRTPPNNVTFTVTGLVSGEDRVLIGPRTGSALEKGQWLLSSPLTTGSETAITIKTGAEAAPIATDTPQDGATLNTRLRVELDSGIYRRQAYTSYTGSVFTIDSTDYSGVLSAAADKDVFCAYVDVLANANTEAYTAVYKGSDRNILVRVRDGGGTPIKTFEGEGVFGSTSSSLAAIRNPDA